MRLLERRLVRDGRGIEHNDIREHSLLEQAAAVEAKVLGGQT